MALDGLLPGMFARVHPRYRTPFVTTLATGAAAAVIAGLFPLKVLGEMLSIGTLLAFTIVCLSVIILRRTRRDLGRTFRTPGHPTVPVLGGVICLAQMIFLPVATWVRLAIWLIIGLIIYFGYGRRYSVLNRKPQIDRSNLISTGDPATDRLAREHQALSSSPSFAPVWGQRTLRCMLRLSIASSEPKRLETPLSLRIALIVG